MFRTQCGSPAPWCLTAGGREKVMEKCFEIRGGHSEEGRDVVCWKQSWRWTWAVGLIIRTCKVLLMSCFSECNMLTDVYVSKWDWEHLFWRLNYTCLLWQKHPWHHDLLGQHLAIPSEWAGWEKAVLFSFTMCLRFGYRHLSISLTNCRIAAKLCAHHGPFETPFLCLVWGLGCLYLRFFMI